MSIPAADTLFRVMGFERVTPMVWELTHGERFTVEWCDTVWRFRNMDGMYCYADSEQGQILSWSGPVTIVK